MSIEEFQAALDRIGAEMKEQAEINYPDGCHQSADNLLRALAILLRGTFTPEAYKSRVQSIIENYDQVKKWYS